MKETFDKIIEFLDSSDRSEIKLGEELLGQCKELKEEVSSLGPGWWRVVFRILFPNSTTHYGLLEYFVVSGSSCHAAISSYGWEMLYYEPVVPTSWTEEYSVPHPKAKQNLESYRFTILDISDSSIGVI